MRWSGGAVRRSEFERPGAFSPQVVSLRAASIEEERERLQVLEELEILGAPPDPAFDALTAALRMILDVPLAFVVILDADRTHAVAWSGVYSGPVTLPREYTFCDIVVRGKAPVVIEDAWADPRYANNPYVMGERGYRFYTGVPLTTTGGAVVGVLCGFDHEPHACPDEARIETLCGLAASVVSTMELRCSERALRRKEEALRQQSEQLQTVLDSVQQGVTAYDQDLRPVASNQRAADLTALLSASSPLGRDQIAPQLHAALNRFRARPGTVADRSGGDAQVPFRQQEVTAGGQVVEVSAVPLAGGGLLATYTDITEERRRAAELQDQALRFEIQERIASIANEAGGLNEALGLLLDMVCTGTKMPVGRIRRVTEHEFVELGIERIGSAAETELQLPAASFIDAARAAYTSQHASFGEVPAAWRGAGHPFLAVYAFPLQILSDVYVFECFGETQLVAKHWHIFIRGYMEMQLTRVAQRERIERLKGEFIATVSHELQTPLTPVLGMLELLDAGLFGPVSEDARNAIAIAYQNSRRLARIVEDVLELETLRAGRTALNLKPCALAPLIAEAAKSMNTQADGRTMEIVADPGCAALKAIVDSGSLVQILSKLLSNALKFSSDAITIRTSRHEERVRISVIDQGRGIAPEFRSRMFEGFAQADGSDRRKVDGAGLGLAIVKALTDLLGASISFETHERRGTTFHLDLVAAGPCGPLQPVSF